MNKKIKFTVTIFVIGLSWGIVYALPFIQFSLYEPLIEALKCNNAQLGILMTIFGVGNLIGAPIGGWFCDKFNYKKILLASLLGNGILCIVFIFNMHYKGAIIVWTCMAVTTIGMNYPASIKTLRMLSDEENQGKVFGLNEAFMGVASTVLGALTMYLYVHYLEGVAGLQAVIWSIAVISFICLIVVWFLIDDPSKKDATEVNEEKEKMSIMDFFIVLKSPETWLIGIGIFSVYSLSVAMSYFTPYFTSVLGVTVALSGSLSIIRTNVLRFGGAPFGGWLADKIKSPTKVLIIVDVLGIIFLLAFMNLPKSISIYLFIGITFIIGFLVYMGRGVYYAVASEIKSPKKYAATTIGVAAALGFLPDLFQFSLFGSWIDKYGNLGYTYMFIFQIVVLVIGIIGGLLVLRYKKKKSEVFNNSN